MSNIKKVNGWMASDGSIHNSKAAAEEHDSRVAFTAFCITALGLDQYAIDTLWTRYIIINRPEPAAKPEGSQPQGDKLPELPAQ